MKHNSLVPHATTLGCGLALAVFVGGLLTSVPARADVDVRSDIRNAPSPHIVFRDRPNEQYLSHLGVYLVVDVAEGESDCFRYQGYYWVFRKGFWYRSFSWRGRFFVVHPRDVPVVLYQVPRSRWKHYPSGPPGQRRTGSKEHDKHASHGSG